MSVTNILILCLMICAGWVCVCQGRKTNPWPWIVAYWAILTVKNALDFVRAVK